MPPGIVDRPQEIWEPLVAVADLAGGHWPQTARSACVAMCRVADDRRVSLGIRLLSDVRILFGDADARHTETLLKGLCDGEAAGLEADAPWGDMYGKPLASRGLATMLAKYGVKPQKVTLGGRSLQGYRRSAIGEAWKRYLPSPKTARPEFAELPALVRPEKPKAVPTGPDQGRNPAASGTVETRANAEAIPRVPEIPDMRETGMDHERVAAAANGAGISAELLASHLSAGDLADPELNLAAYANGLARRL